ncbi:unnamed protein product [Haemonchus placei]|uniref:Uncharacterized protein n=1 Tax=Haemonchus placei TaxID=6290 RepID=A0A3P7UU75_HAEPC|nr:unnamed protein product [Haemonchus placei]
MPSLTSALQRAEVVSVSVLLCRSTVRTRDCPEMRTCHHSTLFHIVPMPHSTIESSRNWLTRVKAHMHISLIAETTHLIATPLKKTNIYENNSSFANQNHTP